MIDEKLLFTRLSLCNYDPRNPSKAEELPSKKEDKCNCSNCFHGRTLLGNEVLRLRDAINAVKNLLAAAEAARNYYCCPSPEEAVNCAEQYVTVFTAQQFKDGLEICEGMSERDINREILEKIMEI
jgi:transposase